MEKVKEVSAREFAKTNAGRRARVINPKNVPRPGENDRPYCTIVGYYSNTRYNYVVIEFEDYYDQTGSFSLNGQGYDIQLVVKKCGGAVWRVTPQELVLCKNQKPFVLYPHTCSHCHAPARKCGKHVMCSNSSCSTGKRTVRTLLGSHYKLGSSSCPIPVICPKCKRHVVMVYKSQSAECEAHGKFKYTYERNKWYTYAKRGKLRNIQFIGGPQIWWSAKNN